MAPAALPQAITQMMGSRAHRMHHYLWHEVRGRWLWYDQTTRQKITALGWAPPRPASRPTASGGREPIYDNNSGEDFFYMHREMIGAVNKRLAEVADPAYPRVVGWTAPPAPEDSDWPIPPAFTTGDPDTDAYIAQCKSDAFYHETLMGWARAYRDPAKLRTITLGELGARIEFTIHNRMHMRWCKAITEFRPDVDPATPDAVDPKWDALDYDWLGDTYSSHVNAVFWKLHGWVDACIEAWAKANNVQGAIPWKGTWSGPFPTSPPHHSIFAEIMDIRRERAQTELAAPSHDHGGHDPNHLSNMIEVAKLVQASGIACHFYDDVAVSDF